MHTHTHTHTNFSVTAPVCQTLWYAQGLGTGPHGAWSLDWWNHKVGVSTQVNDWHINSRLPPRAGVDTVQSAPSSQPVWTPPRCDVTQGSIVKWLICSTSGSGNSGPFNISGIHIWCIFAYYESPLVSTGTQLSLPSSSVSFVSKWQIKYQILCELRSVSSWISKVPEDPGSS